MGMKFDERVAGTPGSRTGVAKPQEADATQHYLTQDSDGLRNHRLIVV